VLEVFGELRTIAKTAQHFRWPPALVRSALAFAKEFDSEVQQQRLAETGA
jgi:hypothetical protein